MPRNQGNAQVYSKRRAAKQKGIKDDDRLGSMKRDEECCITKQTMELASSDLDRHHRALDQALMSPQALNMDSIHKPSRELRKTTCRGKDIDEIEIISDGDGTSGKIGSSTARRNYNY